MSIVFLSQYGPAVDMWSVGCILAELLYESPILPGTHEKEQLNLIYSLCGTPTDESWPDRTEVRILGGHAPLSGHAHVFSNT